MDVFVAFFCVLVCGEVVEPYATVSARGRTFRARADARTRIVYRRPYDGGSFEGAGIYHRMRFVLGRTAEASVLLEKDPGETRCADLAVAYLELRDIPGLDRMVIGDFRPEFGQALMFGRWARAFGGARRRESGRVGYASTLENAGLRGLFLDGSLGVARVSAFVSHARRDATLDEEGRVLFLRENGRHVTSSERAGADVLSEAAFGGRLCLRSGGGVRVGMTALGLWFDRAFVADDPGAFRGRCCRNVGLDWDVGGSRLDLFGEIARSSPGGYGALLGTIVRLGSLDMTVLLRRYDRDFWSFYGSGFSAGTDARNEHGIFAAMTWRTAGRTKISAFFDPYRRPWRTDRLPMPSQGSRKGVQIEGVLCRGCTVALRMRSNAECGIGDLRRRSVRGELVWRPESRLRFRGRMERTDFDLGRGRERGNGVSLMGDVRVRLRRWLTVDTRATFFDTDAYEARIYEFEGDLPGRMSIALLNGRGCRTYVLARIRRNRWTISAKCWWREILSGGMDREFQGSLQVDVSF